MLDDLDRPLGMDRKPPPPKAGGRIWRVVGAAVVLAGVALGATLIAQKAPSGGETEALAPIQPLAPQPAAVAPAVASALAPPLAAPSPMAGAAAASAGVETAQQVETESGVKVFRGGAAAPGAVILRPPETLLALAPAPDRRLVENSRYGLLPRRAADGAAPSRVYARPPAMQPPIKPGTPRIVLVVGGMGLNRAATEAAIRRLPGAVTLAFAPYGANLDPLAAAAREAGHEILLQAPMEPFGADGSPGPHMLTLADRGKAEEDLRWQMGRFVGYIGVMNFLGGRFTADADATRSLMRELAARGLDFVDDGSSPRSLAAGIAGENGVGFVKADLRLDESSRPEAIEAALLRLETLARAQGVAVGYAAGLPGAVDRIAGFAAGLDRRGLALVPLSAAVGAERAAATVKNVEKR
ncbi:divergent polysaccharide deacetylase family protein [uncultured Rhodoblastus sp.]|uniref:divergent polysaccharide deacetylase family protein n=1 Tax=uncultured Rhodoblastus sp. TaxID=543037 RepID=UPI0025EDA4D9|nr:divergent polysaccharide deacetylase family protein [uncultured Rhodoblastus sp.]